MTLRSKLLVLALVLAGTGAVKAQDDGQRGLAPLQGKMEKLASEAAAAVVGIGQRRATRNPSSVAEVLDAQAGGAGFVIDDGLILTASTLVPSSGKVEVIFRGHHRAQAKVLARDPRTHAALLQLDDPSAVAKKLGVETIPHLKLGRSGDLKLGRLVATIGNPYNSIQTDGDPAFSLGVVSALGRLRDADNYKGEAIETDAAVNPGSFGGPLVDLEGRAVGIVIEPYSTKRWLGVAVPIDEVAPILDDLRAGRTPAPPHLGLSVASRGEASLDGLKVADVEAGGPASSAGIRSGDVLLSLDGVKVVEPFDIERELGLLAQGTPVELSLLRNGSRLALTVTLGAARPDVVATTNPGTIARTSDAPPPEGKPYLGITVDERDDGLYVKTVVEDGPAGKAKLAVGVKIVRCNDQAISKKQELLDVVSKLSPGDKLTLVVENSEGFHKRVTIVLGTKEPKTTEKPAEEPPKKTGKPPFLGVAVTKPEDEDQKGLHVDRVLPGSPADKAKIKVGDFVLEIDGKKLEDFEGFTSAIRAHAAGDSMRVKLSRDGAEKEVTVTLAERPSDLDQQPPREEEKKPEEKPAPKRPWVGFAVSEKNGKITIDEVAPGSPAEAAKLKAGWAVVGMGEPAAPGLTVDALDAAIKALSIGDKLVLKVENEDGWTKTVTVTLAERPKDKD
jgi:S1-C subfamily serine protease